MNTTENIRINGNVTVHSGDQYGSPCGAGFNRRGGRPQITVTTDKVTCTKCLKIKGA